jgi:hypothetical protein
MTACGCGERSTAACKVPGRHAEIVDVASAPREQGGVLDAFDRLPDPIIRKPSLRFPGTLSR